jgi:putative FmdB family regulatory protein
MPIYEYKCTDCGEKFEKLVRTSNADDVACPKCGEKHLQQEFSTFAAHANSGKSSNVPMCPSGGPCGNPGMCGLN